MKAKRTLIAAAIGLALSAPSFAVLQRMGPVDRSPTVGGFPAWFQDKTGVTMEFCDLKTQAELDGGWCVLIPPGPVFPEAFPNNFFVEHFYYDANNTLNDPATGFKARLIIALEAAFANTKVVDGNQMTFARTRLFIPNLPIDGDYRVVTPFSDVTYTGQKAGDRIFETTDIGLACVGTFECTLGAQLGPFLLPSATPGGAEVPPMPDLTAMPPGTDPFYDAAVAAGATRASPGTGKKYLADPGRIGPITGSQLGTYVANEIDGTTTVRDHNTFRIEIRHPAALGGNVVATVDGATNFSVSGRLLTGVIPGEVSNTRGTYTADATGAVTELDAYATALPTVQARIPAQPVVPATTPILQYYDVACGGALTVNPATGVTTVNPPPYTAPAGAVAHSMAVSGSDYWGQSAPGGVPPSHLCIADTSARNAAGQVVPAYYLQQVTDDVQVTLANFNGPGNGTLSVNATSSDPTAVLTLASFGPADAGTPGAVVGRGIGSGLDLAGGAATVSALLAPPSRVQVVSTKGGGDLRTVTPAVGAAQLVGVPIAVGESGTINEDCSATPATACAAGAGLTVDLLANDTVQIAGVTTNLRSYANGGGVVTVTASTPRLGTASITNGVVTYRPNANANGTDNILYTVTVNGNTSNQASLAINIVPVNDLPVAGAFTIGGVNARSNTMNLISTSTDPDGAADLRNASIVTWPTQLGARPVPANGVVNFTPTATGNFTVAFRAVDASGALSANTANATVTVIGAETISYTKQDFIAARNIGGAASTRWTVSGTDTVRQGQTLTIAYADGVLTGGRGSCNGTAANPLCVVGTAVVDVATGAWLYDRVGVQGGVADPTDTATWSTLPKNIRTFSSSPVLGGAQNSGILVR